MLIDSNSVLGYIKMFRKLDALRYFVYLSCFDFLECRDEIQGWPIKNKQISNHRHFKGFLHGFFKFSAFLQYRSRVFWLKNECNWTSSSEDMPILENVVEKRVNSL